MYASKLNYKILSTQIFQAAKFKLDVRLVQFLKKFNIKIN